MGFPEIVTAELITERPASPAGIQLTLGFFPMAFFLFFCTPVVVVNGVANRLAWGTHQFQFPPGDYTVKVFFAYMHMSECGANSVYFRLDPGATRRVSFYMWPWMFGKGSMSVI